ncbi:MAG TPA: hypothetical protein VN822_09910 [Candidatus Acidoferrales bacterium]|nr:hypothetical protein [Candidatus Acidoferrales bacterium]
MRLHLPGSFAKFGPRVAAAALVMLVSLFCALPLVAQETGPLTPAAPQPGPMITLPSPQAPPQPPPPKASAPKQSSSSISKDTPSIPVDQIIQQFAAREAEFKEERENFTYTQTFVVQTIDSGGQPDGEYRMTSDIVFTPAGKRYETVTYAPPPTLERVTLSEQDLDDLRNVQPFVLTAAELPKYNVTYVGRQQVDEIGAYVFDVGPKQIEKNQRYFQGRIWVDDRDLEIVKTDGKAVPDIRKGDNENVFPRFETYRENIEGHYWFPTYTHSDDVLHFKTSDVHLRMTVHYSDYKRFRVSMRLVPTPQTQPITPPSP